MDKLFGPSSNAKSKRKLLENKAPSDNYLYLFSNIHTNLGCNCRAPSSRIRFGPTTSRPIFLSIYSCTSECRHNYEFTKKISDGHVSTPEDLSYDYKNGFLYTGCDDGWIRRVRLIGHERFKVEDVACVGSLPLWVVITPDSGVAIAHARKVEKRDLFTSLYGCCSSWTFSSCSFSQI
jgi:hypothetical protein